MKKITTLVILGLFASTPAFAVSAQNFIKNASVCNEFEIESSKLALQKSSSADIKRFAQIMVDDHSKAAVKLDALLKQSDSHVKPVGKLDSKHEKLMGKLESSNGNSFNKQYISIQTDAHKEAVNLFSDYSKNGDDAPLKEFATETLPTLQAHLDHVKQLSDNH